MKRYYLAAIALVLIALAAAVANTLVSKPYITDRIISDDLRALDSELLSYQARTQILPESLSQINLKGELKSRAKNYEYTHTAAKVKSPQDAIGTMPYPAYQESFTLCATFKTSTFNDRTKLVPAGFNPEVHEKGRQCFTDTVNGSESSYPRPL